MDLPILCTLSETDLQERRRTTLEPIRNSLIRVATLPDGYAYSFTPSSEIVARLAALVDLERQCCQFLAFRIVVEPGEPIRLDVTGPDGAQKVIADFFGS
jgi:hypothetical protein